MKKFIRLRQQMLARGVDQGEMACRLGKSDAYISSRLSGRYPWNAREIADIGAWLSIPPEQRYEFFIRPITGEEGSIYVQ